MIKKERELKVYETSGYHYQATPTIMLKGSWLKEWGFETGDKIVVECSEGELRITHQGKNGVKRHQHKCQP